MVPPAAFCVSRRFDPEPATTHRFDRHYLLYAVAGSMRLQAAGRCWSLPPARAAWIAAGAPITVTLDRAVDVCSLLFSPSDFAAPATGLTVFDMQPLLREVIRDLRTFGPDTETIPADARQLFDVAAMLAHRYAATPSRAWMPLPRTDAVHRALLVTETGLAAGQSFDAIANQVGLTPRTLARRFADELGMTWRQTQQRLRMIGAIEGLAVPGRPVTDIAHAVGYASSSAFNAAFHAFMGLSPTEYRRSMTEDD